MRGASVVMLRSLYKGQAMARSAAAAATTAVRSMSKMPDNMLEVDQAQMAQAITDRSREVCGQQMAKFAGGFLSDQSQMSERSGDDHVDQMDRNKYDVAGNANLEAVVQTNVPEPYVAEQESSLKEGVPEGMSDAAQNRVHRWATNDRIQFTEQTKP